MDDLDQFPVFIKRVINSNRRMNQHADPRASDDRRAEAREALQYESVIEQCVSETLGAFREIDPGIFEDFLEIG
jgi:hypothetical protein